MGEDGEAVPWADVRPLAAVVEGEQESAHTGDERLHRSCSAPDDPGRKRRTSVTDRWYGILHRLFAELEVERIKLPPEAADGVRLSHVKEKWGHLRVYLTTETDAMCEAVRRAEEESRRTCEDSGAAGEDAGVTTEGAAWVRTLCDSCRRLSVRQQARGAEMVALERAELARVEAEKAQQDAIMAHARAAGVMKPAPTSPDDDVQKELKALEGTWKAVAMEAGGKQLPKDGLPDFTFIVAAAGKSTAKTPHREDQATITVDPTKSPKTIDNRHESGAHKGKTQFGIYKLEGERWTVCMSLPGAAEGDRPKEFTTKNATNVVFVFERVKPDKK